MAEQKKQKTQSVLREISIEKLQRGRYQPRRQFDSQTLQELANSIQSVGLIEPIIVRPIAQHDHYEIVAGERRWRAAQLIPLHTVRCEIVEYNDEIAAAVTIIENVNREDLNPIEEAEAYQKLIDEFDYTHDEVAKEVGKSRTKITNALRLLGLDSFIQNLLLDKKLTEGHGKILAGLSKTLQLQLAKQCVSRSWSVRKLEREAKRAQLNSQSSKTSKSSDLKNLETALSEHIGCPVNIDFDEGRGCLQIGFHDLDILEGIFQKMGFPDEND